jgi:hypothetical protein
MEQKREKCVLKPIPADELEQHIWGMLHSVLFRTTKENFEEIFDTKRWDEKKQALEKRMQALRSDRKKADNVRMNLKGLLELDSIDLQEYAIEKAEADRKRRELDLRLRETNDELEEIQRRLDEKESFLNFTQNQRQLLNQVEEIVDNLSMSEKQRLLAGMLEGGTIQIGPIEDVELILEDAPIEQWDDGTAPTYKPTWWDRMYHEWRPNVAILKEILGPYLHGDGGNGGGGHKTGNSCNTPHLPRKVHAHRRDEPVSVRLFGRPGEALHLPSKGRDEIPEQDFRTDPRQDRPAHRGPFA